jgi:hypothetical protein
MLISEIFPIVVARLSGPSLCSLFEAVREVQGIIVNRLLAQQSPLLVKGVDYELEFLAGDTGLGLPSDFLAFAGRPYVAGETPLAPLGSASASKMNVPGKPTCYDLAGRTLRIYPPPNATTTVLVPYFYRPPILSTMEGELPFWGEFDAVFIEGCAGVMVAGLAAVADRAFVAMIQSQVDAVLANKELTAEQNLADALNER